MSGQKQKSIISYVPQPYFTDAARPTVEERNGLDPTTPFENADGLFDPDLSNYMTANLESGGGYCNFAVKFRYNGNALAGYGNMTFALVGCSLVSYEDSGGSPNLKTESYEDITCFLRGANSAFGRPNNYASFVHNSSNQITTFDRTTLAGIISGGTSNLIFSGCNPSLSGDRDMSLEFVFYRLASNVSARPHSKLIIGHLHIGSEIPLILSPQSFQWPIGTKNSRFLSRDMGMLSSEGTITRDCSVDVNRLMEGTISGSKVSTVAMDGLYGETIPKTLTRSENIFDLIKSNNSYPVIFNPYPHTVIDEGSAGTRPTAEDFNLLARQNFFAVYGMLNNGIELQVGNFRDGLNSEYRARFSITETR